MTDASLRASLRPRPFLLAARDQSGQPVQDVHFERLQDPVPLHCVVLDAPLYLLSPKAEVVCFQHHVPSHPRLQIGARVRAHGRCNEN